MSKIILVLLLSFVTTVGINDVCAKPGKGKGKAKGHAHAPGLAKQAGKENQGKAQHENQATIRAQHKKHGDCQCQVCNPQVAAGTVPIDQVDGTKTGKQAVGLRGNNGVGNGIDPLPPGKPRENDGDGAAPGAPGNKKGQGVKGGAGKGGKLDQAGKGKGGKPDQAGKGKGGKADKARGGNGKGKGGPKR